MNKNAPAFPPRRASALPAMPYPIQPLSQPLDTTLHLPGSKSITNRALVLAALAEGTTRIEGALFSRDTRIMTGALEALGIACHTEESAGRITVEGTAGRIPQKEADLQVGNAGTAARFLTALLAVQRGGRYTLDGDPAMRERPMAGLIDALEALGAARVEYVGKRGHFPFTMETHGYHGGRVPVDASASSQILSALLLAGTAGEAVEPLELVCPEVRPAYVAITLKLREAFGSRAIHPGADGVYRLEAAPYRRPPGGVYQVEPDLSAASYFLAATLLHGGCLRLPGLGREPLQGDARFADVLQAHGLDIEAETDAWQVCKAGPGPIALQSREIDFNAFSDTFLTYAAVAPLLGGAVRLTGIGHTRKQETDRIAGMAAELSKLGQFVAEEDAALTIDPRPGELRARALEARSRGACLEIDTYEDHRFAMSFAILGTHDLLRDGAPWLAIRDPECCGKTFPAFFDALEQLRRHSPPPADRPNE